MKLIRWRSTPALLVLAMAACDSPATMDPVAAVTVSPAEPVVVFGDSLRIFATTRDRDGNQLIGRPVTWTSSAPGIVSVNNEGLLKAHGWGTARITATSGGLSAWVPVTVGPRPPRITSVAFSPGGVNVSTSDAAVDVLLAGHADSGMKLISLNVEAVRRGAVMPQFHSCSTAPPPVSGTSRAGTWKCTVELPRGSAAGEWKVKSVYAADSAGKFTTYNDGPLAPSRLDAAFQVESAHEDLVPPTLKSLVVKPLVVNVSGGSQVVEFTISATDAGTGLWRASAGLGSPAGGFGNGGAPLEGEGSQAATFTILITVPGNAAAGKRSIEVEIFDRARNGWRYSPEQLQAAGLPHEITVTR
jgi:hypothetical protein